MNRPDWLVKASGGIQDGEKYVCVLEGTHFAIVKMPGGTYWAARGQKKYCPTSYDLIKKNQHVLSARAIVQGRPTKAQMWMFQRIVEQADELEQMILDLPAVGKVK
jgi:hypothetical protein